MANEIVNEDELKERLGISSWRNLSKDRLISFVSDLPNMDKEVALAAIAQFPDFKHLVLDAFGEVRDQATEGMRFNWKSQKRVHQAFEQYREILSKELDREELAPEDRFAILQMLKEAIDSEADKDRENKEFLFRIAGVVATGAVVLTAAALAVLGGKVRLES